MVRTPKQAKYATPEIYNCNMCDKGGWHTENDVEIHKKETHFLQMHAFKARNKDRFCTVSIPSSHLSVMPAKHCSNKKAGSICLT